MISLYKIKTFCVCESVGKSLMGLLPDWWSAYAWVGRMKSFPPLLCFYTFLFEFLMRLPSRITDCCRLDYWVNTYPLPSLSWKGRTPPSFVYGRGFVAGFGQWDMSGHAIHKGSRCAGGAGLVPCAAACHHEKNVLRGAQESRKMSDTWARSKPNPLPRGPAEIMRSTVSLQKIHRRTSQK